MSTIQTNTFAGVLDVRDSSNNLTAMQVSALQGASTSTPPLFQDSIGTQIGTLCCAWVNFNGTGTAAIIAAFNVSSITDNGTGDYVVNFANALPSSNYASCFTAQNGTRGVCCNIASATAGGVPTQKNTFGVQMSIRAEGTGTLTDCADVSVSVFC